MEKCAKLAEEKDDSVFLWKGYINYNLARIFEKKYIITNDEIDKNLMLTYSAKAVNARKNWLNVSEFPTSLLKSFLYEYFLAKIFKYRVSKKYLDEKQAQLINLEKMQLITEFSIYYSKKEVAKNLLTEIKTQIDELI